MKEQQSQRMTKNGKHMGRKQNGRGAASRTSPKRLQALEKQRQALQLRIAGANFDEIAESLGYANRGGAHKAIMTAIENTLREPVAHVRDLELKRLDRLWMAAWKAASAGDLQAITVCLQIMKRRSDFEGLDAPRDICHSGGFYLKLTDEQRIERIQALLERARTRRGGHVAVGDNRDVSGKSPPPDLARPNPELANGSAPSPGPPPPPFDT